MHLVKADETHTDITFEWANDYDTRRYSFHTENIQFKNHVKWFKEKINSPDCIYFIGVSDGKNIGQIRLDTSENSGVISYGVDKKYRGQGYGVQLLKLLEKYIFDNLDFLNFNLIGRVKKENISSVKCFLKCGYMQSDKADYIEFTKLLSKQEK